MPNTRLTIKKQHLLISIVPIICLLTLSACNKKTPAVHSEKNNPDLAVKDFDLAGIWLKRGDSINKLANPQAKEILPGIADTDTGYSWHFSPTGEFSGNSPIDCKGKWKLDNSIITITTTEDDLQKHTLRVIDAEHIVITTHPGDATKIMYESDPEKFKVVRYLIKQ